MSATVDCSRCGRTTEALPKPPLPGAAGKEIQAGVCPDCWAEWMKMEVMVINELRLNFMDPKSHDILQEQMKKFFFLGEDPHLPDHPDQQGAANPSDSSDS